jgi:YD repeat-containing protein
MHEVTLCLRCALSDAQGNETRIDSDALGRPSGSTEALSYSSQTQYNALDHVSQTSDAMGQNSTLSYDAAARIRGVVNPAGVTLRSYGYDAQGRVTRLTDALLKTRLARCRGHAARRARAHHRTLAAPPLTGSTIWLIWPALRSRSG